MVHTVCTTAGVARGTARAGEPRTASSTHYIPCYIHAAQTTVHYIYNILCIRVEGPGRSEASPPVAPFQSPEERERTPSPEGTLLCPHCRTDCRPSPTSCQHGCKPQRGQRQQFAVFLCPPPPLSTLRTPRECPQVAALARPWRHAASLSPTRIDARWGRVAGPTAGHSPPTQSRPQRDGPKAGVSGGPTLCSSQSFTAAGGASGGARLCCLPGGR